MLRGILSHKIFEHVQNFRDYFAPLGDTCEEITNHGRLFRDCFATHSRCLSPAVAKQSQSSEIGALRLHLTLTLWVQCIVHLRSTFQFLPSKRICVYVVIYALVHYEKAMYIECSAVYIVTEPNVN